MGKIVIKEKMKSGETLIGKVQSVSGTWVTLQLKDDSLLKVSLSEKVCDLIDDDCNEDDLISVEYNGSNYTLEMLDEWPK